MDAAEAIKERRPGMGEDAIRQDQDGYPVDGPAFVHADVDEAS